MVLKEEGLMQLHFGKEKRIQLLQTSYERCVVGKQGCLLGSLSNKWIFCIPPGALDYEQEIVVSFYHVTDSCGLAGSEFVTGIIEITPHQLQFSKPVELLLRHRLFIEDDNSEVTVLYHSGETVSENFTSLCHLSSIDERAWLAGMKTTLWDDFVHIEASHLCKVSLACTGNEFIVVWASLFAPEYLDKKQKQFFVRVSLHSQAPRDNDEDAERVKMLRLVRRSYQTVTLNCAHQEKLQLDVEILNKGSGWKVQECPAFNATIAYNDVKDMVVKGKPLKTYDIWFSKGKSRVDVTGIRPIFKFNGAPCSLALALPALSSNPSKLSCSGTLLPDQRMSSAARTVAGNLLIVLCSVLGHVLN